MICPRCKLNVIGDMHRSAEDCVRHLVPQHERLQRMYQSQSKRYRNLEGALERARIKLAHERSRVKELEAAQASQIEERLQSLEKAVLRGVGI